MSVTKPLTGPFDFHIYFSYYVSQSVQLTVWLPTFFKISSFVFSRRKKFIQVWNNLRIWWQNFHFEVNYPFKGEYYNYGAVKMAIFIW